MPQVVDPFGGKVEVLLNSYFRVVCFAVIFMIVSDWFTFHSELFPFMPSYILPLEEINYKNATLFSILYVRKSLNYPCFSGETKSIPLMDLHALFLFVYSLISSCPYLHIQRTGSFQPFMLNQTLRGAISSKRTAYVQDMCYTTEPFCTFWVYRSPLIVRLPFVQICGIVMSWISLVIFSNDWLIIFKRGINEFQISISFWDINPFLCLVCTV